MSQNNSLPPFSKLLNAAITDYWEHGFNEGETSDGYGDKGNLLHAQLIDAIQDYARAAIAAQADEPALSMSMFANKADYEAAQAVGQSEVLNEKK